LVNGLHAAVADLLKPPAKPQAEKTSSGAQKAQVSRREAEAALKELRRELSRAVKKWSEMWSLEAEKRVLGRAGQGVANGEAGRVYQTITCT
jgi:hypothetical protein